MDLDKIREFHVLAKTLNFTQAARGLNISVSALSKHIQALENELGVRLLSRNANGSQGSLTEAGKAFYNETGPWLEEFEGIVGAGNESVSKNEIKLSQIEQTQDIVMCDSLCNNWLNAIGELFKQHGCKVHFKFGSDMPIFGDAFPLGPRNITIVPEKFTKYYLGLDVEDVEVLDIEGGPYEVYPFLIYRKDAMSASVREIVQAFEAESCAGTRL